MFRWFIVLLLLSAGAYTAIAVLAGVNPWKPGDVFNRVTNNDSVVSNEGSGDVTPPVVIPDIVIDPKKGQANQRPVVLSGARIVVSSKQEVSPDRDGQIVHVATDLKNGEEKTLPPDRIITAT